MPRQEQYEAVLKAAPQDIAVVRLVADFYRRTGKPQPAEALLQKHPRRQDAGQANRTWLGPAGNSPRFLAAAASTPTFRKP